MGEEERARSISRTYGIEFASIENHRLKVASGQGLQGLVPEKFARENIVVPLFIDHDVLAVAIADPDEVMILDELQTMSGRQIQPFVATKTQILRVIGESYP